MLLPVKGVYILYIIILLVIMISVFYKNIENHFVFAPQKKLDYFPSDFHMEWKDLFLNTPDGQVLNGWFFPSGRGGPVILFCHGNAGNISHRLEFIRLLTQAGADVFIFDYRGYGKSTGRPSEKGIYTDALCAYDYLVNNEKIKPADIILLGRSLGAAAAMEVATKREARSLIVESGFLSTGHMARHMALFSLVSPLIPRNYNNLEKIKTILIPKLIMHGDNDELVPFSMGQKLYEAANPPKYFYPVQGAGHNDTYIVGGQGYENILREFVRASRVSIPK